MERIDDTELKKMIDYHMVWSNTSGKDGMRLYLCNRDLSDLDFSGLV